MRGEEIPMKHRLVFSVANVDEVSVAVAVAGNAGVATEDISIIARSDIQMHPLIQDKLDATTDMIPAALRGMATGGGVGIVAGIVAFAVPPIGITIVGVGLMAAIGAAVGGWSSALMGSTAPNEVRQRFENEIKDGRVLLILDCKSELIPDVKNSLANRGFAALPFDELSVAE
jgi:hypothetical protein